MNAKEPANFMLKLRRMTRGMVAVGMGTLLVHAASAYGQQVLVRGNCTKTPGATVKVPVDFALQGSSAAGVQNDLTYDAAKFSFPQAATGTGTCTGDGTTPCVSDGNCQGNGTCNRTQGPKCVVGDVAQYSKEAFFSNTSGFRGIAVGIDPPDNTAFVQDSRLYACDLTVGGTVPNGVYKLEAPEASAIASNPNGEKLPAKKPQEGYIVVGQTACIGDLSGNQRADSTELGRGLDDFSNRENVRNPAADWDCNGRVSSSELGKVLDSFANRSCLQG